MSISHEAMLELLFTRPAGPPLRIEEDFLTVRMDRLTRSGAILDIEASSESLNDVPNRQQSLDWDRLRDANDDYDEILVTPNGKLDSPLG